MASLRERFASAAEPKKKLLLTDPSASSLPASEPINHQIARLLGQTTADVPYSWPQSGDPHQLEWKILNAPETALGIYLSHSDPSQAWIAVRLSNKEFVLIHTLPVLSQ